jgi:hypothetical protein
MKKLTALLLLFILTAGAGLYAAEPAPPSRKAELFYSARRSQDLSAIAALFHPDSFRGHRKYTEISLEKLRASHGAAAVEAMLGKSEADLAALGDREFFLYSVGTAWEIQASSPAPDRDRGSFRVLGQVEDGVTVYTLTAFDYSYSAGDRRMDLRTSESMGFRKDGDEWKIVSFPFASPVTRAFTDELIRAVKSVQ